MRKTGEKEWIFGWCANVSRIQLKMASRRVCALHDGLLNDKLNNRAQTIRLTAVRMHTENTNFSVTSSINAFIFVWMPFGSSLSLYLSFSFGFGIEAASKNALAIDIQFIFSGLAQYLCERCAHKYSISSFRM